MAWRLCQAQRVNRLKDYVNYYRGEKKRSEKRERKFKLAHPLPLRSSG